MGDDLKRYRDWSPTQFDTKGLACDDQQDWFVAPVIQTRDSEALERSNFRVLLADLERENLEHEVHCFNHWGPGWFEIILIKDTEAGEKWVRDWEAALSDYPVADESDWSELETEEQDEWWNNGGYDDVRRAFKKEFGLSETTVDFLDCDEARDLAHSWFICGQNYENGISEQWIQFEGTGLHINLRTMMPEHMALFIRGVRAEKRKVKSEAA